MSNKPIFSSWQDYTVLGLFICGFGELSSWLLRNVAGVTGWLFWLYFGLSGLAASLVFAFTFQRWRKAHGN